MAKNNNTGLFALLALMGLGFASSLQKRGQRQTNREYGNLRLMITGVHVEAGNQIVITVAVQNPNSIDIKIQSVVGTLYANIQQIASVKMYGDYTAKSNSEVSLPLLATVLPGNIFNQFRDLMTTGRIAVILNGTININNTPLPISLKYNK